ncbi:hypothetical protein SAMN05421740_11076 [Parapedobacter koreensis]|uniref:Uncharacterized protein n=2 Tax=Parapedobacter koreensis TaxID=332977 RepID=A0A1H7T3R8_9SPHI|nr:hypothetical protein SAMN05421740_11076 [Parapedobacter koreensis]
MSNSRHSSTQQTMGDLGYFMGYAICKSYYEKAHDKKLAIKAIIELDYADLAATKQFLESRDTICTTEPLIVKLPRYSDT